MQKHLSLISHRVQIDLCKLLSRDWLKLLNELEAGASLIRSVYGRKEVDYYLFIAILNDNKEGIWICEFV